MAVKVCLALAFVACCAGAAFATDFAGPAHVIDGDTITIGPTNIRLYGIDAPEYNQLCQRDGQSWRCGQAATLALVVKVSGRQVTCTSRGTDRNRQMLAVCTIGTEDLNGWLVSQGWALAYRHDSKDYVGQEVEAKDARRGLWAGEFEMPWEYRHNQ